MPEVDHTHPAVLCIGHVDAVPAVVFIQWATAVVGAFQRQVLHAALADEAFCLIDDGLGASPLLFDRTGQRCIESDVVAIDGCNGTVPLQVNVARMPCPVAHSLASAERLTAQ